MSLDRKTTKDLSKLAKVKLLSELNTAQKHLFSLRMKLAQGELKETHQISQAKKYIATIKMFLSNPLTQ